MVLEIQSFKATHGTCGQNKTMIIVWYTREDI